MLPLHTVRQTYQFLIKYKQKKRVLTMHDKIKLLFTCNCYVISASQIGTTYGSGRGAYRALKPFFFTVIISAGPRGRGPILSTLNKFCS